MSVCYKIRQEHGLNFLTCTIVGWIDLFSRQVYRDIVIDCWRYCQEHKGLEIHAFVFMSNHIHLIASCKPPFELTQVMRDWKRHSARQILNYLEDEKRPESRRFWIKRLFSFFAIGKKYKQEYQVWQHDNHPIELYSPDVIEQKLQYIHLNPVKAGWVCLPEHWKYSSAGFYEAVRQGQEAAFELLLPIKTVWERYYETD